MLLSFHSSCEGVGGLLLPAGERVGVDVRRYGHAGMSQPIAHDDVLASLESHADVEVTQAPLGHPLVVHAMPAALHGRSGTPTLRGRPYPDQITNGKCCCSCYDDVGNPSASGTETGAGSYEIGVSAEGQNRTDDTSIFSAVLYQLSYLGAMLMVVSTADGCQDSPVFRLCPALSRSRHQPRTTSWA